jgi:hypothetical protein
MKTSEEEWASRGIDGNRRSPDGKYKTHRVELELCEGCLLGLGQECHTPACALCWHNSPGHPLIPELVTIIKDR